MAVIGEIAVNVVAQTQKFVRGLGKARNSLADFARSARSSLGLGAGVGGLASAGLLVREFNRQAEAIDELAKSAQKLGATTEGLAALQHGAELSGVSFDLLTRGMSRMQDSLSEFALTGKGRAVTALKQLKLDAKGLIDLKADDAFAEVAEAISNVGNAADRTRIAMDIFGRSGSDLMVVLREGKKGLAGFRAEADRLGLTFSAEEAKKVEDYNDAITRLKATVTGFKRGVVIGGIGAGKEISEGMGIIQGDTGTGFWGQVWRELRHGRIGLSGYTPAPQVGAMSAPGLTQSERRRNEEIRRNAEKSARTTVAAIGRALGSQLPGIPDLSGLASQANLAYQQQRSRWRTFVRPGEQPVMTGQRQLNEAISASSSEGFIAMRANMRNQEKDVKKIEMNTGQAVVELKDVNENIKRIALPTIVSIAGS